MWWQRCGIIVFVGISEALLVELQLGQRRMHEDAKDVDLRSGTQCHHRQFDPLNPLIISCCSCSWNSRCLRSQSRFCHTGSPTWTGGSALQDGQPGQCQAVLHFATRQESLGPRLFAAHHEGALPNHRLSQRLGRKDKKGDCSRSSLNEDALIIAPLRHCTLP